MSRYYEDEEDIDFHIRRGRASPGYARRASRLYRTRSGQLLDIELDARRIYSRSRDRRSPSPAPVPVIINNHIDTHDYEDEAHYLPVHRHRSYSRPRSRSCSRSHSRHRSPPVDPDFITREKYELELARRELETRMKLTAREEDERRYRRDLEVKHLRDERRAEEEKAKQQEEAARAVQEWKDEEQRRKEEKELAIKEYKMKEAEEKEKKDKEEKEREKEYQQRLQDALRRSGMDERQIALVLQKDQDKCLSGDRPTYTRMARRYLSTETLNVYHIDYALDMDPEYILIKRWVPEHEQDFLWNHTKELRERRLRIQRRGSPIIMLEEGKHKKQRGTREYEYEIVRKERKRSKSPAPLLTFFAGGK